MKEVGKVKTKRKKKFSFFTFFAFIFIFAGVAILIYPIVGNYLADQHRSEATSHYNDVVNKLSKIDLEQQLKLAQKYNENIFANYDGRVQPYPNISYDKIANQDSVMGTLDIPAISIKGMPFYHGTDSLTLNRGLGHFKASSIPIGGKNTNAVIAGHSGLENQVLFNNVMKLQTGDIFYINILGKRLAYQIKSMDEVLPDDIDKIKIMPGKDIVTLVTCTPPGINTYRLLVKGERIPLNIAQKEKINNRDKFSYENIVLSSIVGALLLGILLFIIYRRLLRNIKRAEEEAVKEKNIRYLRNFFYILKGFFVLLIILILGILGFAFYGYRQIESQHSMGTINIGSQEQLSSYNLNKVNTANYTEDDISSVNVGTYTDSKIKFNQVVNNWGIGKIYIPSQDLSLPILAGMENTNLMNGASTYSRQQQLGRGNYILLAHNIVSQEGPLDVLFWRLVNLKEGDVIYTTDFKKIYSYSVMSNKVINQKEVSVLKQPKDRKSTPIITLIRCEGGIGTPLRRVVQGRYIKSMSLSVQKQKELNLSDKVVDTKGIIYNDLTYPWYKILAMKLSASILSNPIQTVIPIFLLLIIPIIFLSLI